MLCTQLNVTDNSNSGNDGSDADKHGAGKEYLLQWPNYMRAINFNDLSSISRFNKQNKTQF